MKKQDMEPKPKRRPGRPSEYTPEKAAKICHLLANGKSLKTISKEPGMPDDFTILRWIDRNEEFRVQYARARERRVEKMAEEMLAISDDPNEDPQSRRVRVDTRKWLMSKWAPKKYGEKLEIEHQGEQKVRIMIGGERPTSFIDVETTKIEDVPAIANGLIETKPTEEPASERSPRENLIETTE